MRKLTRWMYGDDRPKQFCSLLGARTLLEDTRQRAERSIPAEQILFSLTQAHEDHYLRYLADRPSQRIVQPLNKGTAPAILFALMRIAQTDAEAIVSILPCDHYYSPESAFTAALESALEIAEQRTESVIVLGTQPTRAETEYGWIEIGEAIGGHSGPFRVKGFQEKPSLPLAEALLGGGSLWNTSVMVGHVGAFLAISWAIVPDLMQALKSMEVRSCPEGEVRIPDAAYRQIALTDFSGSVLELATDSLLAVRLDNIEWKDFGDSYRVLVALFGELPGRMPETHPPNPQTVAVLPLHNQSGDPEQDYFCDGITDDIIYALSRIPGLNVIGHASVFAFKGIAQDAREVGAKLGAGTVVDGAIRKSGNRVKIFTEMLDAMTGEVHWAQTYERPIEDVFAGEAEIAEAVARVLQMMLAPPVSRGLICSAPNMDAYLLYLRGRHAWNRMSADGYRTAAEILERVTSLYPSYASAYAGLADAYVYLAGWGGYARPREVFPKALRAAQQALRLDPSLPHAYSSLAAATAFYQWKWNEGVAYARTATELEPSYSFGQHVYGCCLVAQGEMDQARECLQRAVDLDPFSVRAHRMLGSILYFARRFVRAEQWLQAALVLDREPAETHYLLANLYMSQGRFAAALEQAKQCQTDPLDPLGLSVLGACLAHLNRREEALEILATLSRMAETRYVESRAMAHLHIALGNIDQAIESVARSLDEHEPFSVYLKLDPAFDPLRGDPRFDVLVSRLGR